MKQYRGSRKHVLDWVEQPAFQDQLFELLRPVVCTRDGRDVYMPISTNEPAEARLESFGPRAFPEYEVEWRALNRWWLANGGNTPNWDIAVRANVEGTPGLILVEAKANCPELRNGPKKPFKLSQEQVQRMSVPEQEISKRRSLENNITIDAALSEVTEALRSEFPTIILGRTSDYQLSNRIAFTWKVASLGIPVVLLYLGFIGDDTFGDKKLIDGNHWKREIEEHLKTIGSPDILGRRIDTGNADMWMLVKPREVLECSPPATPRA